MPPSPFIVLVPDMTSGFRRQRTLTTTSGKPILDSVRVHKLRNDLLGFLLNMGELRSFDKRSNLRRQVRIAFGLTPHLRAVGLILPNSSYASVQMEIFCARVYVRRGDVSFNVGRRRRGGVRLSSTYSSSSIDESMGDVGDWVSKSMACKQIFNIKIIVPKSLKRDTVRCAVSKYCAHW